METLKLKNEAADVMREFYKEELQNTIQRLEHLKDILSQLGETGVSVNINISTTPTKATTKKRAIGGYRSSKPKPASTPKRRGRPPKAARKRAGRKSKWAELVLERLNTLDRPLTYNELTEDIMAYSKLPKSKTKSTKQAVLFVTFQLRHRDKKLKTFSASGREKYVGLNSWFDGSGKLKTKYLNKLK